jgi:hypothetical protein
MVVAVVRGIDMGNGFFQPSARIVLRGRPWVGVILSAFCAEFEKDNPSPSALFTLEPPNPMLACITSQARDLSVSAQQAAVWMYTDHLTFNRMREKFAVDSGDWAAAKAVVQRCQSAVR